MSSSKPEAGAPIVWQTDRYPALGAASGEKAYLGPDELYELSVLHMPGTCAYPAYFRWGVWGGPLHRRLLKTGEASGSDAAKAAAEACARRLLATVQLSADAPAPDEAA